MTTATNLSTSALCVLTARLTGKPATRTATKAKALDRLASAFATRFGEDRASAYLPELLVCASESDALARLDAWAGAFDAEDDATRREAQALGLDAVAAAGIECDAVARPAKRGHKAKRADAPETATVAPKAKRAAKAASDAPKAPTKRETMLVMVRRPEGATEAEICETIGWKACLVTLRRAAVAAGLTLRSEKQEKGRARYFAS